MTRKRRLNDAIAYRRVSTKAQGNGIGLDGQMAAIERYAELERLRITDSFMDVASGMGESSLGKRPGLQAAIDLAKRTGRPIIVSGLDRISRHAKTINDLLGAAKITVISAGDGKLRNPILIASEAARSQREGELTSQRTKKGLARRKAEGVLLGNRKNLPVARKKAHARWSEIARQTVENLAQFLNDNDVTGLTASEIAAILNEHGIRTSRGLPWTVPALRRPLRQARELVKERDRRARHDFYAGNPNYGRF